jgi:hypothetical protein
MPFDEASRLRIQAAALRSDAERPHLLHPERKAKQREANRLEGMAEGLEAEARRQRDSDGSLLPTKRPKPPPPVEPAKRFPVSARSAVQFTRRAEAATCSAQVNLELAAEWEKRAPSVAEDHRKRARAAEREARGWSMLARGLIPTGWTPTGPKRV